MNHQKIARAHKHFTVVTSALVVLFVAFLGLTTLIAKASPIRSAACTIDANLVNSCRPWLGATAGNYPNVGTSLWDLKGQILDHERRIGRNLGVPSMVIELSSYTNVAAPGHYPALWAMLN